MPITQVEANHEALEIARGEISGLAMEQAAFINGFERRQNPVLIDIVELTDSLWKSLGYSEYCCWSDRMAAMARC